jgi:acetamidase/formamidase
LFCPRTPPRNGASKRPPAILIVDTHGYKREQAYCLTSVAVDLQVSQMVDAPNLIVSATLPLDIFD